MKSFCAILRDNRNKNARKSLKCILTEGALEVNEIDVGPHKPTLRFQIQRSHLRIRLASQQDWGFHFISR